MDKIKSGFFGIPETFFGATEVEHNGHQALKIPIGESAAYIMTDRNGEIKTGAAEIHEGPRELFGLDGIIKNHEKIIIVTGSVLNALAIYDAGGVAIALGDREGMYDLIAALSRIPLQDAPYIVVSVEDSGTFKGVRRELAAKLATIDIDYCIDNIAGPYDEPYTALCHDHEKFEAMIANVSRNLVDSSGTAVLQRYLTDKTPEYVSTGFRKLNKILGGGLIEGLTVIGAVPSLGKTTFVLQIACNIALSGRDVIYCNLESSARSMVVRTLSRLTYELTDGRRGMDFASINKKTYSEDNAYILDSAVEYYQSSIAPHMYIYDGSRSAENVRALANRHKARTGKAPVIIVDYLQYLEPPYGLAKLDKKQLIDNDLKVLKDLAHGLETPVIVISAYNRDSFYGGLGMTSNSGSGQIDYLAETSIALTYADLPLKRSAIERRLREISEDDRNGKEILVRCDVVKGRDSGTGSITLAMTRRYYAVRECSEDEMLRKHMEEEIEEKMAMEDESKYH